MEVTPAQKLGDEHRSSTISNSLLERIRSNDDSAWDRIVDLYGELVYRLCRVRKIPPEDAKDIAQEVFRAAHRTITNFRRDRPGDSFHYWLLTITKSKISDHFRRQKKIPAAVGGTGMQSLLQQVQEVSWDDSDEHSSAIDPVAHVVHRAIRIVSNEVEPATWNAFWEIRVEGRSANDVAHEVGKSKWAVYQASSRVARRLREELRGFFDESRS